MASVFARVLSAAGLALWSLASHCCRTRAMAVEGAPCLGQLRSPSLAFHDISVFRMNCRTLPRDSFRCQPVLSAPAVGLPCCQCSGFTLCIRFVTCAVKVAAKMCGQRNFTFPNHDGCRCDLCRFTSSARPSRVLVAVHGIRTLRTWLLRPLSLPTVGAALKGATNFVKVAGV